MIGRPMRTVPSVPPSLARAIESLRDRGLELRRGSDAPGPDRLRPPVPTGHPALDVALGTGGWTRGAVTLLDGPAGSGGTTLAMGALAACQRAGGLGAWLDLDGTFDPAVAATLGVSLEWLLVARPADGAEAVELAAWLARSGLIDLLVLDLGLRATADRRALDRFGALLARSATTAALLLAPAARSLAGTVAGVRLALRRTAWLAIGADVVGQRVVASVERHRWAASIGTAELDLWFGEGRRIDSLAPARAEPRPVLEVLPAADPVLATLRVAGA
jgi:recombination protein RecA